VGVEEVMGRGCWLGADQEKWVKPLGTALPWLKANAGVKT
jgi:hypothetical protein